MLPGGLWPAVWFATGQLFLQVLTKMWPIAVG
jgi:hypothetical protein